MAEYIEKEKATKICLKHYNESFTDIPAHEALYAVTDDINKIPAADVAEVRHGEWLYVSGNGRHAEYECSECRAHVCFDEKIDGSIPRYKGCPHCLAKMDGKDGEKNGNS